MNRQEITAKLKSLWTAGSAKADQCYNKLPLDLINEKAKCLPWKIDVKSSAFKRGASVFFAILVCLLLYMVCSTGGRSVINVRNAVIRDGIVYKVNSTKPYTGTIIAHARKDHAFIYRLKLRLPHPNTTIRLPYKKGRADGKVIVRHTNNQIALKAAFKNGRQHGKWTFYDENGNMEKQITWEDGIPIF